MRLCPNASPLPTVVTVASPVPGAKRRASPTRITVRSHSRSPARSPSRHNFAGHKPDSAKAQPGAALDVGHIVASESNRTGSTGRTNTASDAAAGGVAETSSAALPSGADSGSEGAVLSRSESPDGKVPASATAMIQGRDVRRGRPVKFTPRCGCKMTSLVSCIWGTKLRV